MEIYSESMELLENPDLTLGWLEDSWREEHHPAVEGVEERWHFEVVREYENGGKEVRKIIDIPGVAAQEAWTERISIRIYHPYTQEQLDAIEAEKNKPTAEERITALEEENRYLKEALDLLLSGETEVQDG